MTVSKPIDVSSFIYKEIRYEVEFYEIKDGVIPDLPWQQVYFVGNIEGKVPIVEYASAKNNLPGGGIEAGESIEDALRRESLEEINMEILDWYPVGYQINTDPFGKKYYQLRVYANLRKVGDFKGDIGGSVVGYRLIDITELEDNIAWGAVGNYFIERLAFEYGKP